MLVADILSQCDIDLAGPLYLIHLEDHTQAEPFDVGRILVTAAKVKEVYIVITMHMAGNLILSLSLSPCVSCY